ncbi:arylacetamide deacetylase [Moesziomyces antarcticus T-34]|uniref:Arylacetamide deacetylase n=1 Tax=Pseudozyma antarctica (strain T-34) TaxID=1151754 RepID=M9M014_PSEA3|nr:arylacetamide deacetylase [Moesziomyces antarcticus T-34]
MTITTAGTAVNLAPTVTKTFFKHYYKKAKRSLKGRSGKGGNSSPTHNRHNALDEFMFDEAFHIVKAFIEIGTSDTVEAIQDFTDAPAPPIPWATTLPVMIPMESCDKAAKLIIDHLGPEDLQKLVGGEKWWQLRAMPGVQGEWIAMSNDWKKMKSMEKKAQQAAAQAESNKTDAASGDSKASAKQQKRRRNKRHERALSEIRAMRAKTESALKRRSQSFKRPSHDRKRSQSRPAVPGVPAPPVDDAASAASSDAENAQPTDDATDAASDAETDHGDTESEELDRLQRVMLYFHGGGYYFGSLATHRYQIVRYARKFGGKCFAPIYRKAPQYPWPCALQDAVASYLYLIDPPKGAKHRPVDPKKIVVAGDSAGGGLSLALLTVIRDMGLPAPAGAVLISPWCDLTHSFPSILQNTATDIIPPYGFIHKPSTLWPINATKPENEDKGKQRESSDEPQRKVPVGVQDADLPESDAEKDTEPAARKSHDAGNLRPSQASAKLDQRQTSSSTRKENGGVPPAPDLLWSQPIKIQTADAAKQDIELREQIQLYATNDQLTHPLCSAVLSGSLGGLPPLYILAGDAEVLRDEIVYLAHRAAHPQRYPLREDLLDHSQRNRENAAKYDSQPTKVHLQVYDQMCHVLTAFAFTSQSRFAYRAVASFVKHVTGAPTNIKNPFPEVPEGEYGHDKDDEWHEDGAESDDDEMDDNLGGEVVSPPLASSLKSSQPSLMVPEREGASVDELATTSLDDGGKGVSHLRSEPEHISPAEAAQDELVGKAVASGEHADAVTDKSRHRSVSKVVSDALHGHPSGSQATSRSGTEPSPTATRPRRGTGDVANEYTGQVPLLRPSFQSFMIRERVDVRGYLRQLEPESDLPALQLRPDQIGCIKEGPVARYLDGQTQWAKRYTKTARKVEKHRARNEKLATKMLEEAAAQGLMDRAALRKLHGQLVRKASSGATEPGAVSAPSSTSRGLGLSAGDVATGADRCREKWSWLVDFGPMDLVDETPPPAAVAGRRDTNDALLLLRKSLQIRARAYGVQRKSRFWGAEDRPVRAHMRATTEEHQPGSAASGDHSSSHHHRGLRVWNLLMVKKPPSVASSKKPGKP